MLIVKSRKRALAPPALLVARDRIRLAAKGRWSMMSAILEHEEQAEDLQTEGAFCLHLRLGTLMNRVTDAEFFEFCMRHKDLRIERTSEGDLIVMTPTGGTTGRRNSNLLADTVIWAREDDTGIVFDSSTCFTLPNGAVRSPDVSWVRRERWDRLTEAEQDVFPPICPDFVIELRSRTDSLKKLQAKMEEYIANGTQLGWLLDAKGRAAYVYRPGQPVERLDAPPTLAGDPELPNFVLDVAHLWR